MGLQQILPITKFPERPVHTVTSTWLKFA